MISHPPSFATEAANAIDLHLVTAETLQSFKEGLTAPEAAWAERIGFGAGVGEVLLLPHPDGALTAAAAGLGQAKDRARQRFGIARSVSALPEGTYRIVNAPDGVDMEELALGWLLSTYAFDAYATQSRPKAQLIAPTGIDATRLEAIAAGEFLTRDLINTPASDMGPADLEHAIRNLAGAHGAKITSIVGDELLDQNFPMIHTVGRAAADAPRLLELRWGDSGPSLTLVGKGVCFDTGGLNIKPGASMGLMKKDMGGAATVMGLAHMIMALDMELRLRVLIPAVENSIAGNAFRPQDILTSRKGLTVEINNTDAEGRLVLADALAYACEEDTDAVISMATLTGAARVAVGPDLAPFYTDDADIADAIRAGAAQAADPVWELPFHDAYEAMIEPGIADLDNAPKGGFAGSITAALFLRRFVEGAPYVHFDIYGWQPAPAPARPKGGVGQGARALLAALPAILKK